MKNQKMKRRKTKKWGYKILSTTNGRGNKSQKEMEEELNKLGRKGWNLVNSVGINGSVQYSMKREKQQKKKKS